MVYFGCANQAGDGYRNVARMGAAAAYRLVRERVPFQNRGVYLSPILEQTRQQVAEGTIKRALEAGLGLA